MRDNKPEPERLLLHQFIRRSLALATLSLTFIELSTHVGQNTLAQTTQIVPSEDEIALTVTVRNQKGGYVAGLKKKSLTVLIDKTPQEISHFAREDVPVSIGILIDTSGSIRTPYKRLGLKRLNTIRDGLAHFVSLSNEQNEYFLLGFAQEPRLFLDNERDGNAVADRIASLELKGTTSLYDACYMGIEKVAKGAHRKRAIILVSDGMDNSSKRQLKQVELMLKETDVLVYSLSILGIRENPFDPVEEFETRIGNPVLIKFARQTGGLAFFPSQSTQIKTIFELIALELRNQYRLAFRPRFSGKREKWQALKIKVTPPASGSVELGQLIVRTREGFYPSAGLR